MATTPGVITLTVDMRPLSEAIERIDMRPLSEAIERIGQSIRDIANAFAALGVPSMDPYSRAIFEAERCSWAEARSRAEYRTAIKAQHNGYAPRLVRGWPGYAQWSPPGDEVW